MRSTPDSTNWWADLYDDQLADVLLADTCDVDDTVTFLVQQLRLERGSRVFDQCCGTGRLIAHYLSCRPSGQVIVCSGYVQEELLRRDLDSGAHAYLPKPFHVNELLDRIAQLMQRSSGPAPPRL